MSLAERTAALAQAVGEEFAAGMKMFSFYMTGTPTTAWKSVTFDLPVPLNATRGLIGSLNAGGSSSTGSMVVATIAQDSGMVTQVTFRYASIPANLGASTALRFIVAGYPA